MVRVIVRVEMSEKYRSVTFINSQTGETIILKSRNKKLRRRDRGFSKKN